MKLLVVGSRSIKSFDLEPYISENVDLIISGGADGIDNLAEKYADKKHISKYIIRPCYKFFGRAAPIMRNKEMVNLADKVLAIWDGSSRGVKSTIDYARKLNKPIDIIILK